MYLFENACIFPASIFAFSIFFPFVEDGTHDFLYPGHCMWYPMKKMYSADNRPGEEQLADMKYLLLEELKKLI